MVDTDADADVVVIGAGIVGLATARALVRRTPGLAVVVIDKEGRVAAHQSGHNSGVIHSGIYYRPGSSKATMVATGRRALLELAREHDVPHDVCGKVVAATEPDEIPRLLELRRRGETNGVEVRLVDRRELQELEPHCEALLGLHVPSTGIIDFAEVCRALARELRDEGTAIELGQEVTGLAETPDRVRLVTGSGSWTCRMVVNCAGLQADRLAARTSAPPEELRIMPFRGEYHDLTPASRHLVRNLIYPVPDPRFPFLGVHLTRMIDGSVHAGPNAVAALRREGYSWRDVDATDLAELLGGPDSRHLARRYWRTGAAEIVRSLSTAAFVRALQRLVPDIRRADVRPAGAGVRAQAVRPDGTLLDDFAFAETPRVVSVLNAPSPAATASLEIGRSIARRVEDRLRRSPS